MLHRLIPFAILVALVVAPLTKADCCGGLVAFRNSPTFREYMGQESTKYLACTVPIKSNIDATGNGSTEMKVLKEIKTVPSFTGKKTITIGRYLPVNKANPQKFLIFADVKSNKLEAFRGVPIESDDVVEYLGTGMGLDPKDSKEFLGFYFQYLEHVDPEIAADAFLTFAKATDSKMREASSRYSPTKLRNWLQDADVIGYRLEVYALLLGMCGEAEDAGLLLRMLQREKDDRVRCGYRGLLIGYLSLEPERGWAYLRRLLGDADQRFQTRFAALRAIRYLRENRPEIISNDERIDAVSLLLDQKDIADLAIEDLRRWECWEAAPHVFALQDKEPYKVAIVRRSILRYALASERTLELSANYVNTQRANDPKWVKEVQTNLAQEQTKQKPSPSPTKTGK